MKISPKLFFTSESKKFLLRKIFNKKKIYEVAFRFHFYFTSVPNLFSRIQTSIVDNKIDILVLSDSTPQISIQLQC